MDNNGSCLILMNALQEGLTGGEGEGVCVRFLLAIFKPMIIIIVRKSSSVGAAAWRPVAGSGRQHQLHGPFFNPALEEGSVKGKKGVRNRTQTNMATDNRQIRVCRISIGWRGVASCHI